MNRRQRLAEVVRACRREAVTRWPEPPDWAEWGSCRDCGAQAGKACVDDVGSTRAPRLVARLCPHDGRLPIPSRRVEVER